MSIATDITVDIMINNVKVDEYELSDTLDNYTIEEIHESAYCGMYNPARRNNVLKTSEYGWVGAFDKDNGVFQFPFKITPSGGSYIWDTGASSTGYNTPDGIYGGTVWLRKESAGAVPSVITTDNIADYRMVTKWNVNKFVFSVPALSTNNYTEVASSSWEQQTYPCCYVPEGWGTMTYHTDRGEEDDETVNIGVYPYNIFIFDEKIFFIAIKIEQGFIYNSTQEVYTKVFGDSIHWSFDKTTTIATSYNNDYLSTSNSSGYNQNFSLSGYPGNDSFPVSWQGPGGYTKWYQVGCDDEKRYLTLWDHSGYSSTGGYIRINSYFSKVDDVLQYFANMGVYFYTDKLYKPIIENTIVTGYTDELSTTSDIDNWDGTSIHDVPITPPVPPTPATEDDSFESMTTGFSSAIGGITKYYKMSYSGLISLINDFNQHAPAGTTISNSIVSLYVNALVNSWTTFNTPIEIHTAGAQETPFTSVLEYPELYLFANPMEQLGYIDVPRVTNTFYDYNPYSTYELYVPFCGWIGLPDTIAGRRLRVELHMDIATMNCRALVRCEVDNGHGYDSTLCGEISGAIGAPCPLEVIEGGLYRQSFVNSALQLVSGGTMAIVGGMSGANALMASGAMNAIQGLANARMAGNTNYTQVVGRSGDCSGLAGAHKCYLKISHPVVDKVVETSLFGHSVGYICDIVDKLKNFKGFTVCLNPHITINATQTEKEEIKRLLEDGVIL